MTAPWLILISSLLSGLIGAILSFVLLSRFYRRFEIRKQKIDTFRRLLGNRFAITEDLESIAEHSRESFFAALNEVIVVFSDSDSVSKALQDYDENVGEDNLLRLIKAICKDLKIPYEFNDSLFLKPFTPGPRFRGNRK